MTDVTEYRCSSCGFEWRGERQTCPRCREPFAQPSLFDVPRVDAPASDDDVEAINQATANASMEWVGLPEFAGVGEPLKVVVSCETADDRDELLLVLGIETIHKGTRGTLSVWWPDRPKDDLASLRFVDDDSPEFFEGTLADGLGDEMTEGDLDDLERWA